MHTFLEMPIFSNLSLSGYTVRGGSKGGTQSEVWPQLPPIKFLVNAFGQMGWKNSDCMLVLCQIFLFLFLECTFLVNFTLTLTLVLQWYFLKRTLQLEGGGGKWPPRCISGPVPPRAKIPKAIPMFWGVSFSTVPMLTLSGDSFTPKFNLAPENRK